MITKAEALCILDNALINPQGNSELPASLISLPADVQDEFRKALLAAFGLEYDDYITQLKTKEKAFDSVGKVIKKKKAQRLMSRYKKLMDKHDKKVYRGKNLEKYVYFSRGNLSDFLDKYGKPFQDKKDIGLRIYFSQYGKKEFPKGGKSADFNRRFTMSIGATVDGKLKDKAFFNFGGVCPPKCTTLVEGKGKKKKKQIASKQTKTKSSGKAHSSAKKSGKKKSGQKKNR